MGILSSLRRRPLALLGAAMVVAFLVPIVAQEGFPLKGSWIGTWTGNTVHGDDVLMVLSWDGKNISGVINPGTDNMKVDKASLDPAGWKVHLETDGKDKAGAAVHYVIDGALQKVEL